MNVEHRRAYRVSNLRCIVSILLALLWPLQGLLADEIPAGARKNSGPGFSASATAYHQPGVDIDGGGEFTLSSGFFRFKLKQPVSSQVIVGLSLKFDIDDYDFSGLTEFGGLDPWNDVHRFGIGVPILIRLSRDWAMGISPSVDWLQENGADTSESITYGAPIFAFRTYARDKRLGLGAGVFKNVEDEINVFPFIAVDWRFNEHWRISNPFEADVLGPAGLELSYDFNDRWYLGGGGVYRRFRFRLDDQGVAPGGIGRNAGIVSFLRLHRDGRLDLDFYVGATFEGKLELKNADGDNLAASDYDTAPFVAITVSGKF